MLPDNFDPLPAPSVTATCAREPSDAHVATNPFTTR